MERIIINNNTNGNEYLNLSSADTSASCNCTLCGSCLLCILFAPLVGAALGVALGAALAGYQA